MRAVGVWLTLAAFGALHAASPHRYTANAGAGRRPPIRHGAVLRISAALAQALAVGAFVRADGVPCGLLVATAATTLIGSLFVPFAAVRPRLAWPMAAASPFLALAHFLAGG